MLSTFAFGSNGAGQLGLGHREDVNTPTPCVFHHVPPSHNFVPKAIAAGGNHTLLLTELGEVYATGDNTSGQCCIDPATSTSFTIFHAVQPPPNGGRWKAISAGWAFSILIADNDQIYAAGQGSKGELGVGQSVTSCRTLTLLPGVPLEGRRILQISSCVAHTVVTLDDGELWGWGAGRKGQLGQPNDVSVASPRRIKVGFQVRNALCGRDFTFCIDESGSQHVVLGANRYGLPSDASATAELAGYLEIGVSWGGVYVLKADGSIAAWGRDDHGQVTPIKQLFGLGRCTQMAIGSEHGLAVVESTEHRMRLVAWGWGEHGNCGPSEGTGLLDVRIPTVSIVHIGAGCATSWIFVN
ncbi:RCC1 domain-containing protein [Gaertneriomyces semiglobifer]|nr:RCC1 domain-containing protein [Gaertneriomyces semiglobifer]